VRTFNFEDEFKNIDEVLQEVKVAIFQIPQDALELVQLDWSTQLLGSVIFFPLLAHVVNWGVRRGVEPPLHSSIM